MPERELAATRHLDRDSGGDDAHRHHRRHRDANLAKFNVGDRQIPIRVQLSRARATICPRSAACAVPAAGGTVPLSSVADVRFGQGPSSIDRYDRERRVVDRRRPGGRRSLVGDGRGIDWPCRR